MPLSYLKQSKLYRLYSIWRVCEIQRSNNKCKNRLWKIMTTHYLANKRLWKSRVLYIFRVRIVFGVFVITRCITRVHVHNSFSKRWSGFPVTSSRTLIKINQTVNNHWRVKFDQREIFRSSILSARDCDFAFCVLQSPFSLLWLSVRHCVSLMQHYAWNWSRAVTKKQFFRMSRIDNKIMFGYKHNSNGKKIFHEDF